MEFTILEIVRWEGVRGGGGGFISLGLFLVKNRMC